MPEQNSRGEISAEIFVRDKVQGAISLGACQFTPEVLEQLKDDLKKHKKGSGNWGIYKCTKDGSMGSVIPHELIFRLEDFAFMR